MKILKELIKLGLGLGLIEAGIITMLIILVAMGGC